MRWSILISVVFVTIPLHLSAQDNPQPAQRIQLHATLAMLPKTTPCETAARRIIRVTALYRVDKVVKGNYADKTILVVHRCPEIPRGPSRYGRGDAGKLKPGNTHLLTLDLFDTSRNRKITDPFTDDRRPRWAALRTNQSSWPPRVVVVIEGGAGTRVKLPFDTDRVMVGRAADSDVKLLGRAVRPRHLLLRVKGDHVEVSPVGTAATRINGKALKKPAKVTFQDRLVVDSYTLRVALFLSGA